MGYVVVSHRDFASHFIYGQDGENALRRRCDTLAWAKEIVKKYASEVKGPGSERRVHEKLEKLKEISKAQQIRKSQINTRTRNLPIPSRLNNREYAPFIRLAEAVGAAYLITGGGMFNELQRHWRNFNFIPIEANAYTRLLGRDP